MKVACERSGETGLAEGQEAQANCILPGTTVVAKCNCVSVWFQQPALMGFFSSSVKFCVARAFARMTLIVSHVLSVGYSLDQLCLILGLRTVPVLPIN